MKNEVTAHLVAIIDPDTFAMKAVDVWGPGPPWQMTRMGNEVWASLMESSAETFHEAAEHLRRSYPFSFPHIHERFPLKERR